MTYMEVKYYAFTQNRLLAKEFFGLGKNNECRFVIVPEKGYEIHIGTFTSGWEPLYIAHPGAYEDLEDMAMFFFENEDEFEFYSSESRVPMVFSELMSELAEREEEGRGKYGANSFDAFDHEAGYDEDRGPVFPLSYIEHAKRFEPENVEKYKTDDFGNVFLYE